MKPLPVNLWDYTTGMQAGAVVMALSLQGYAWYTLVVLGAAWFFGANAFTWFIEWLLTRLIEEQQG